MWRRGACAPRHIPLHRVVPKTPAPHRSHKPTHTHIHTYTYAPKPQHLGIKDGETTSDGLFTLREVECLGACANAPMIQMNDDYYECLTPATTVELLEACKRGEPPRMGKWGSLPMNGQVSCEGPLGKTTLIDKPGIPPLRTDWDKFEKVDPVSVKVHMGYGTYEETEVKDEGKA